MSKRNLTLGSASGKLGSVVYMRRRGQQIARMLVPAPRNPKTINQCGARASFANYVAQWRALRPFVADTWRGVSRYGTLENAFARHSRGLMPAIPAQYSREGQFLPTMGLVTYGALPVNCNYAWLHGQTDEVADIIDGVYLLDLVGQRAPTSVEGMYSKFKGAGVAVEEGDVLHIMLYSWYTNWAQNSSFAPESTSPAVQHMSAELSSKAIIRWDIAFPHVTISTGMQDNGTIYPVLRPNPSLYPNFDASKTHYYAIAVWIERPSNPQYARYTRSRWALNYNLQGWVKSAFPGSNRYTEIANTYR